MKRCLLLVVPQEDRYDLLAPGVQVAVSDLALDRWCLGWTARDGMVVYEDGGFARPWKDVKQALVLMWGGVVQVEACDRAARRLLEQCGLCEPPEYEHIVAGWPFWISMNVVHLAEKCVQMMGVTQETPAVGRCFMIDWHEALETIPSSPLPPELLELGRRVRSVVKSRYPVGMSELRLVEGRVVGLFVYEGNHGEGMQVSGWRGEEGVPDLEDPATLGALEHVAGGAALQIQALSRHGGWYWFDHGSSIWPPPFSDEFPTRAHTVTWALERKSLHPVP